MKDEGVEDALIVFICLVGKRRKESKDQYNSRDAESGAEQCAGTIKREYVRHLYVRNVSTSSCAIFGGLSTTEIIGWGSFRMVS